MKTSTSGLLEDERKGHGVKDRLNNENCPFQQAHMEGVWEKIAEVMGTLQKKKCMGEITRIQINRLVIEQHIV